MCCESLICRIPLLTRIIVLFSLPKSGLVTAATDGKVNFWSLANLRDAAESVQVDGNISCLAVAPESHSLVCGDESGALHLIQSQAAVPSRSSRRPIRKIGG